MVVLLLVAVGWADDPAGIRLADAVARAQTTPSVEAAQSAVDAARASVDQAWPGRLPSLTLQGNVLVYDKAQELTLFATDETVDCSTIPDPFGSLCEGFGTPTVIREQVTSSATAQLTVPITGQVAVDRQVAAARAGLDAAAASSDAAVADAELEAKDAWYAAAEAEQQLAIALAQVRSMEGRVRIAEAAFEAGTLTKNDLLLVQIASAKARQAVSQLTGYRDIAYARLGAAAGEAGSLRPLGADDAPPRTPPELGALVDRASATRPEITALRAQVDASRANAAAVSWSRLPSISGMGVYQHTTGQGAFGSPDTAYVGATLSWNVWSWGKMAASATEAKARAEQLSHVLDARLAGLRLELQTQREALAVAVMSWTIAGETVEQTAENLAIQERRASTGNGTMQELLDADLEHVRAESMRASAVFDARRAEAGLVHALGADPWVDALPPVP